ncbi:hypothetical protein QB714_004482 [Salmonella enterica]|nr:hypothetical protein [Salmonella enterica]EEH2569777.1 hypothetical protein [Salmonella enterica]EKS4627687.1 hypothetical protein [Salmonella enterica]EKS4720701.1 hypothetical protein [Salmonella enterica]EKS4725125.1 hypothetical protein [Salmonella enterica]
MAYHIEILKFEETDEVAKYKFRPTSSTYSMTEYGIFEINKKNGEFNLLKQITNDTKNDFYMRAMFKILTCWRKGYLPEKEEWAS